MKHFFTLFIFALSLSFGNVLNAQQSRLDALFAGADTTAVFDSLMQGFDAYLDSLTQPRSYFIVSAGIGTGLFNFTNKATYDFTVGKKALYVPEVSYFHKSGFGLSATGYLLQEAGKLHAYQYALSSSYHLVKSKHFATGVSFTRYFTRDKLSFYTTPIQNELYTFFSYKKWWLEPGLAVSYGWGSKTKVEQTEVEVYMKRINANGKKTINIRHDESIKDLSMLFSVRHSFEWFKIFNNLDMFSITPVLLISGGTQNFGFNTSFSSNSRFINNNILPANQNITDKSGLHFQSATCVLQLEYMRGRFYVLPQLLIDYYLHQADKRVNNVHSVTFGYSF
ncbi:MAG: hypothetical protein WKF89_08245 [Chitinophagaceae bacterium]